VLSPFDSYKAHVHFESTYKFDMHKNEEQCEGGKMEVDLVVTLESWLTKLEITSNIGIFFYVANNKVEGVTFVLASTL
jgi:hypothetical protein